MIYRAFILKTPWFPAVATLMLTVSIDGLPGLIEFILLHSALQSEQRIHSPGNQQSDFTQ